MVRRTVELFECDICGEEGQRYTVTFPEEGVLSLDRCERHRKKIEALKNEKGSWSTASGRSSFKVSTPEEIERQRQS